MEKLIATIPYDRTSSVLLRLREFKGKSYIDLRIFFRSKEHDELIPTRRGITLNTDLFEPFYAAIQNCANELAEKQTSKFDTPLQ